MSVVRVVVADDDDAMLSALLDVIGADERFDVVGSASSGDAAVDLAARLRPELVVLDVRMPGGGAAAVRAVLAASDGSRVVAVSADHSTGTVVSLVRAGAVGFLAKGRLGQCLPDLLHSCATGGFHLAVPVGRAAFTALREPPPDRRDE